MPQINSSPIFKENLSIEKSSFENEKNINKIEKPSLPEQKEGGFSENLGLEANSGKTDENPSQNIIFATNLQARKKERERQITKILEQDLEKIYIDLSSEKRQQFKIAGEKTVNEINVLLDKAKFKIKSVIILLKKWLSLIPNVNSFFLEKMAKIKSEEIIKLKNHG
jgi:hypothetical protein